MFKVGSGQCYLRHFGWDLKPNPGVVAVLLGGELGTDLAKDHQHSQASLRFVCNTEEGRKAVPP